MLKTKFLFNHSELYDGSQLKPLWIYLNHGLLGSSGVAWVGPCDVSLDKMLDGEDKRAGAQICGDQMLHFVFELFDTNLLAAVCFQRLMANWVQVAIGHLKPRIQLVRRGDDLYFEERKLSISIATPSLRSSLVHFAINVTNEGAPVPTCALEEWQLDPQGLAQSIFLASQEWQDIWDATYKVHSV